MFLESESKELRNDGSGCLANAQMAYDLVREDWRLLCFQAGTQSRMRPADLVRLMKVREFPAGLMQAVLLLHLSTIVVAVELVGRQ